MSAFTIGGGNVPVLVSQSDAQRVAKYASLNKLGLQPTYLLMASRGEIPVLGAGGDHSLDVLTGDQRTVVCSLQILISMIFTKKAPSKSLASKSSNGRDICVNGNDGASARSIMSVVLGYLCMPSRDAASIQAPLFRTLLTTTIFKPTKRSLDVSSAIGQKRARDEEGEEGGQQHLTNTTSLLPGVAPDTSTMYPPLFFLDAPFTKAHSLFVAMFGIGTLTDEELNTYFGRYGFIGSEKVNLTPEDTASAIAASPLNAGTPPPLATANTNSETSTSAVAEEGDGASVATTNNGGGLNNGMDTGLVTPVKTNTTSRKEDGAAISCSAMAAATELLSSPFLANIQCFIIKLDSNKQCVRALSELRHTEVLFMAPHDASRNDLSVLHLGKYLVDNLSLTTPSTSSAPDVDMRHLLSVLGAIVAHVPGSSLYNHVAAGLKVLHHDSSTLLSELREAVNSVLGPVTGGGMGGDGSGVDTRPLDPNDPDGVIIGEMDDEDGTPIYFVPDVIIENIPYWSCVDGIRDRVSQFGIVLQVQPSINDRNGAMMGSVLVKMRSVREALRLCEGLNGEEYEEGWGPMVVGVATPEFNLESLDTATVLNIAAKSDLGGADKDQPRMWV